MVSLPTIRSSNSLIASALPPGLVAVFVGGTNGIGETTLKQFAKHARQPRIYFIGRSQEAGDSIAAECKALNSSGEYFFVKTDTSLIRNVDDICRDIKAKEKAINLLFLTQGCLIAGVGMFAVFLYARSNRQVEMKYLTTVHTQKPQKASTMPPPS
jgi:short-subunit dehydrogenase